MRNLFVALVVMVLLGVMTAAANARWLCAAAEFTGWRYPWLNRLCTVEMYTEAYNDLADYVDAKGDTW